MTTLFAIAGFALLFAVAAVVPLRGGGGCGGDCGSCGAGGCDAARGGPDR